MSTEANLQDLASAIQLEARRFGRVLSPGRAAEIAREVQRYDDAIQEIASTFGIGQEPSDFLQVLMDLAHR